MSKETEITEITKGMQNQYKRSESDPKNGHKDDLVAYFNILLDNVGTVYSSEHYTIIDLMEQQGGLMQCVVIISLIIVRPFNYKRHELQIFQDFENKFNNEY